LLFPFARPSLFALACVATSALSLSAPAQTITVDDTDGGFTSQVSGGVVILMYHGLDAASGGFYPPSFDAQMDYLKNNGFHTITMDHLKSWIQTGAPALPSKPIVLTFDDNYITIYTVAYPKLQALGFVGCSYAHTNYVGVAPGGSPATSNDHADWIEIGQMESSGVIYTESHTLNHLDLTSLTVPSSLSEVANSKAAVEANMVGKTCRHFSYPYGAYNATTLSQVSSTGYETAVTTVSGPNTRSTPLLELKRYGVNPNSSSTTTLSSTFLTAANAGSGSGAWAGSSAQPGFLGSGYKYSPGGVGDNVATWSFTPATAGVYEVYARWTVSTNRATNSPYAINHQAGSTTVRVNQKLNNGVWMSLGQYTFNGATPYQVTLSDDANGYVIADGVKLEFRAPAGLEAWQVY
jgi:peptidoglycan/xylan/chitin deacetylase (PgdA/CDA1 family)